MTVSFELDGQEFVALNGGPEFTFDEAISFQVSCDSQAEVDDYWDRLGEGGQEGPCGWLKDKYGVSWQVVPTGAPRAARRSGPGEGAAGHEGHAPDEQDRHRGGAESSRGGLARALRQDIGVHVG